MERRCPYRNDGILFSFYLFYLESLTPPKNRAVNLIQYYEKLLETEPKITKDSQKFVSLHTSTKTTTTATTTKKDNLIELDDSIEENSPDKKV